MLLEGDLEGSGNGVFPGVGETGDEDCETLFGAGWVGVT